MLLIIDGVDEPEDATRRTRLANERTYLAWWRTGLTSLAVGIGAGKIAPELAGGRRWPYVVVGAAYSVARDRVHRVRVPAAAGDRPRGRARRVGLSR